jgi:RNA polymerase sigma-70 factor, ECF subfamily
MPAGPPPGTPGERSLLATIVLLRMAKDGDTNARDELFQRYHARLTRWAAGRLPVRARSLLDTSDLVQETLVRVLEGLDRIEIRGPGGFQAYVRQAVLNRIADQVRWASRRPGPEGIPESLHDASPSPLENAIGSDVLARYERAFAKLSEDDRELLHLRIELDIDHDDIARMTGKPSRDATRMAVKRALSRLAEEMDHDS